MALYTPGKAREQISDVTSRIGQKLLNQQLDWLFKQFMGNIPKKGLSGGLQGIIDNKVDAETFIEELAEKAGIGDLPGYGTALPATPAVDDVFLYMGVVPNEWLRWKGVGGRPTERRYTVITSSPFSDLSDNRKLAVTVSNIATQAGTGTPHPVTNKRAISKKATLKATVNGVDTVFTLPYPACGLPNADDRVNNLGYTGYRSVLVEFTGLESVQSAGLQAGVTGKYRFWLSTGYTLAAAVATNNTVGNMISSHFPVISANQTYLGNLGASIDTNGRYEITVDLSIIGAVDGDSDATKISKVKAWLAAELAAGTPVQVLYQRAVPIYPQIPTVTILGADGTNTVTTDGTAVSVEYTGSGWTNVGNTFEMAALLSDINANTVANDDFRGLLQSIEKRADGLLLTGLGGTLKLLLGPSRISFLDGDEEVAYITGSKLYIYSAELLAELRVGNYIIKKTADGGIVFM